MPNFAYTARDDSGAAVSGMLAADSIGQAMQMLRQDGKYPTSIRPAEQDDSSSAPAVGARGIKVSRADVIHLSQQLAIMVETGVTLSESLDCIAAQAAKPQVKKLVEDLGLQVQSGGDFSSALARHPRSFPRLYVALIKASEKSGMLGKLLTRATHYLRDEQETLRRVKGALTYPGIMLTFAISTTVFLLAFVLPKFTSIYAGKGAALPTPTRVLMTMSNFVTQHWLGLLIGLAAAGVGGFFYFRTRQGARVWHWIQLNVPLLGPMFRKLHLSRGLRMMGTLAGAGVSLVDGVQTAHDLCGNSYFRDLWTGVAEQIQTGKQLSEPLFQSSLVPRSVSQMLHSGEKSGKLSFVLEQVAGFAEEELKEKIADLTRYIEPLMIMVMGVIIGGVAMSLLLPIFTISRVMSAH